MSQKKRKYLRRAAALLTVSVILSAGITMNAAAINDDGIKRVLETFPEYFVINNFIRDTGHLIAWTIVKGLYWLAAQCTSLYSTALGFVDFTTYPEINQYISTLKGVFTAILAVSLVGLGVILIIDHEKKPKILKSLFLMGLTISASSFLLTTLSTAVKEDAREIAGSNFIAEDVINSSVYDLLYIDSNCGGLANMSRSNLKNYHYASGNIDVNKIDINETINYDSDQITTDDAKEILKKRVTYIYNDSDHYEGVLSDIYNGFGWNSGDDDDFFNDFYYRFKVDYFYIYVCLIAVIIVYVCMSYKVIRIVFEIVTGRILAYLYSANINGIQKTVKILESILNGYIVLMLTSVLIKLFEFARTFLDDMVPYNDSPVANCLLLLFLAFSVIDGPNIIQQITGIDAGLSSGFGKMVAAYHMASAASRTVQSGGMILMQGRQLRQNSAQQQQLNKIANTVGSGASSNMPLTGTPSMGGRGDSQNIPPTGADASVTPPMGGRGDSQNVPPTGMDASVTPPVGENLNGTPENKGVADGKELQGNNNIDDSMSEKNLESEMNESPMDLSEGKPEMVDLVSKEPEITADNMAEHMNRDLNMSDIESVVNGSSGLGVQSPVNVDVDGWSKYQNETMSEPEGIDKPIHISQDKHEQKLDK